MSLSVTMADQMVASCYPVGCVRFVEARGEADPHPPLVSRRQVGWRARRDHLRDGLFRDGSVSNAPIYWRTGSGYGGSPKKYVIASVATGCQGPPRAVRARS
jgi:hypothetical protein